MHVLATWVVLPIDYSNYMCRYQNPILFDSAVTTHVLGDPHYTYSMRVLLHCHVKQALQDTFFNIKLGSFTGRQTVSYYMY